MKPIPYVPIPGEVHRLSAAPMVLLMEWHDRMMLNLKNSRAWYRRERRTGSQGWVDTVRAYIRVDIARIREYRQAIEEKERNNAKT